MEARSSVDEQIAGFLQKVFALILQQALEYAD
jgi:hypothetical protein